MYSQKQKVQIEMLTASYNQGQLLSSLQESIKAQLGEIEIVRVLNRGSEGMVFLIRSQSSSSKTQYAMKVISKANKNSCQKDVRRRVENETKINQALNSKFFVKFFKHFEDKDSYYLIFQYCKEGDLRTLLLANPSGLHMRQVRGLGLEIAKGISTLHKKGVVHRDIKLHNILIDCVRETTQERTFEIKICDFGLATILHQDRKLKGFYGTLGYMAPEIYYEYDEKIDVWSYGCTLAVLATGAHIFQDLGKKIITQEKLQRFRYPEQLPEDFVDLLKRIFVFDSSDRISMNQVIKHRFFTGQLAGSKTKRKLSNEISEKSDYQLSRHSSGRDPENQSGRSSQQSLGKRAISNYCGKGAKGNGREKIYCDERGTTPPTFRGDSNPNRQQRMGDTKKMGRLVGTIPSTDRKAELLLKLNSDGRKNSKRYMGQTQKGTQRFDCEVDQENDPNLPNRDRDREEVQSAKETRGKKSAHCQYDLKSEAKERSRKMVDSKLGKVMQIKSNQLSRQPDRHNQQSRPTVPNRCRPVTSCSTTACKTTDALRNVAKRNTNYHARSQNRPLVIDRKITQLSPVRIEAIPDTEEIQCSRGRFKITSEGFFKRPSSVRRSGSQTSISGTNVHISPNGQKITISKGHNSVTYSLEGLPEKYRPMYLHCKSVIQILKDRTQLSKIEIRGNYLRLMASGRISGKIDGRKVEFLNEEEMNRGAVTGKMKATDNEAISDRGVRRITQYFKAIKKLEGEACY